MHAAFSFSDTTTGDTKTSAGVLMCVPPLVGEPSTMQATTDT